jgi:hypothetical protein
VVSKKPLQKRVGWKAPLSIQRQFDRLRDRRSNGLLVGCRDRAPRRHQGGGEKTKQDEFCGHALALRHPRVSAVMLALDFSDSRRQIRYMSRVSRKLPVQKLARARGINVAQDRDLLLKDGSRGLYGIDAVFKSRY